MKVCIKCENKIYTDSWECSSCGWVPDSHDGFPLLAPELANGGMDFPIGRHDQLAQIEDKNFWFISRNKLLIYFLDKYFPCAESLLEIGCGTGFVLSGLFRHRSDMNFFGAEAYTTGLKHAKKRMPKAVFAQMDVCNIPFVEEFDIIGAFDLLEHIADDWTALREMHKALKSGGGIMITVPQHPWLWSNTDEKAGHKRRYTRKELSKKIKEAGFDIIMTTSFLFLLFPFIMAIRLLKNYSEYSPTRDDHKVQAGLRLADSVNAIFIKACDLERAFIQLGFSMPFGGSLVCIAKKR